MLESVSNSNRWAEPLSALMLLWKLSHRRLLEPRSSSISLQILTGSSTSVSEQALLATLSMLVWIPPFRRPRSSWNLRRRVLGDALSNDRLRLTSIKFVVELAEFFSVSWFLCFVVSSVLPIISDSCFLSGNGESFVVLNSLFAALLNFS